MNSILARRHHKESHVTKIHLLSERMPAGNWTKVRLSGGGPLYRADRLDPHPQLRWGYCEPVPILIERTLYFRCKRNLWIEDRKPVILYMYYIYIYIYIYIYTDFIHSIRSVLPSIMKNLGSYCYAHFFISSRKKMWDTPLEHTPPLNWLGDRNSFCGQEDGSLQSASSP